MNRDNVEYYSIQGVPVTGPYSSWHAAETIIYSDRPTEIQRIKVTQPEELALSVTIYGKNVRKNEWSISFEEHDGNLEAKVISTGMA